ncbi:hypothetical protein GCM10009664_22680 [Kitasatospora gansuensis]
MDERWEVTWSPLVTREAGDGFPKESNRFAESVRRNIEAPPEGVNTLCKGSGYSIPRKLGLARGRRIPLRPPAGARVDRELRGGLRSGIGSMSFAAPSRGLDTRRGERRWR